MDQRTVDYESERKIVGTGSRELTNEETVTVSGGLFPVVLLIVALALAGCATTSQGGTVPPVQHPSK
jgi:lactobin A/cerein 7B family class IIb bacteriocin